jgi:hypothetical protein
MNYNSYLENIYAEVTATLKNFPIDQRHPTLLTLTSQVAFFNVLKDLMARMIAAQEEILKEHPTEAEAVTGKINELLERFDKFRPPISVS